MTTDLGIRYEALKQEMVQAFERTAAIENHGLMYVLLGLECLAGNAVCQYVFLAWEQASHWPVTWGRIGLLTATILTIKLFAGRSRECDPPIARAVRRVFVFYLFLCMNVGILNLLSGQPRFAFLPALAVLTSFAFTVLTTFVSRKFTWAGIAMFLVGLLMAALPRYAFLIYGAGWFVVLEVMGGLFLARRRELIRAASLGERKTAAVLGGRRDNRADRTPAHTSGECAAR